MKIYIKAFTLAEILIVLVLIGVLTAILLPVAFHAAPDENVMKFKKGHNLFATVIRKLVTSDKYYQDGDLGIRANGALIDGTHSGDVTYLCNTFAEIVNTKSVNCSEISAGWENYAGFNKNFSEESHYLKTADTACKYMAKKVGAEVVTSDGIIYYQTSPKNTFGISMSEARKANNDTRYCVVEGASESSCKTEADYRWYNNGYNKGFSEDANGFDVQYKYICMDIDGIDKGEDPFAYAVRVDGKILVMERAQEWLEKSLQKEN